MTAYVNWSWEAPIAYWDTYGGANLLLPNGDLIGNFGDPTHRNPQNSVNLGDEAWNFNDTGAVFVEVNPAGQVVRTFTFPVGCYVYRIETITNPASIVFPTPAPIVTRPPVIIPNPTPVIILPTPTPTILVPPTPNPSVTPTHSVSPSSTPITSVNSQTILTSAIIAAAIVVIVGSAVAFYFKKRTSSQKNIKGKDNS
jgi:hypothetical protein